MTQSGRSHFGAKDLQKSQMQKVSTTIYRASFINHLRQAWPIALYASIIPILPWWVSYFHGIDDPQFATIVASVLFGLVFFPHLLIHLRYSFVSSNLSVDFLDQEKEIVIKSDNYAKVIRDFDIESVDMVLPRSLARQEIFVYPWQIYGYAILKLVSGEEFLITSLVVPRLKFPFEFRNVNTRERLYCWPP